MKPTPTSEPSSPADAELVRRLIAGQESAFSEVYEAEKGVLYGFLLRLSGNPSVAADLFQNVWLKLAKTAPQLAVDSHLRGWLLTVARREYLSFRRAEVFDVSRLLAYGVQRATSLVPTEDPGLVDLQRALNALNDTDRELLLVTAMDDLLPEQSALILELQPATYRKRLSRARCRLEQLLAAQPHSQHGSCNEAP